MFRFYLQRVFWHLCLSRIELSERGKVETLRFVGNNYMESEFMLLLNYILAKLRG